MDVDQAMNVSLAGSVASASGQVELDNLYPALVECFGIIVLGYLAAKLGLVSEVESHGLSTFAGTFALPALIFGNLCALDFGSVSWSFLAAVLLAKTALFAVTALGVLAAVRPPDPLRAGLYAIFVTQSNDFALGFPILQAIYGASHPEIPMYLYLFAPISLVILNPIGFVLMEIGKNGENDSNGDGSRNLSKVKLLQIAKNVVTNPIIFMTVAGIIANFVFGQTLPGIINRLLTTLGNAFSACALFLLGLRIVSKSSDDVKVSKTSGLIIYAILILLKTVALPLVSREFVNAFGANDVENNATWTSSNHSYTSVMSDFAFLYGTFPTAPSVFVYAVNYEVEPELVASAMVACTFVAAPIMFVSAKLMSLTDVDPKDYIDELDNFLLDISILGLAAAVWTAVVFFATKKHAKVPHFMTLALIIAQVSFDSRHLLCSAQWTVPLYSRAFRALEPSCGP
jgi:predicted permease